jgi:ABC-type molybdate transport system substrate-binding protein
VYFNMTRYAAILLGILLSAACWANAATKPQTTTIKVLSSDTETIPLASDNNGAAKDCNLMDFSAYCHHSRNEIVRHKMVVEDATGKTFALACTVDTMFSKCASLPAGTTSSAQWTKHGLVVWYPNQKGREVKQLYKVASAPEKTSAASDAQAGSSTVETAKDAGVGAPVASDDTREAVINFSSTPPGAEIMLDGSYVGNIPSSITAAPGRHVVELSMPGFATWKRELQVTAGSKVDVDVTLQKTQQ